MAFYQYTSTILYVLVNNRFILYLLGIRILIYERKGIYDNL